MIYPSTDKERSRAFYEGILGLTPGMQFDQDGEFWVEYEIGPHTLAIGKEPFLKPCSDGVHLALEVADFDEAIDHLRKHKVEFSLEPVELPGCFAAIVVDPDGNKLGIHQRKSQSS